MTTTPHPIQIGEQIPNTQLWSRWQNGREISPLYVPGPNDTEGVENGCREAERAGRRSVTIAGTTYIHIGAWYAWDHPSFDKGRDK
jgi:hypothetical protein